MNINKLIAFFILIFLIITNTHLSYATINLTVSPIKEDITINPWETVSRTVKLTNNTAGVLHIITWKSDFEPNWDDWKPNFIRKSELVFQDQQLSEWISLSTSDFNIAPWETKSITYTLTVPANATPGGHYWAVFFKNNSSETSSWAAVWINVDYGVIILVNVAWNLNTDIEIKDPVIKKTDWWWSELVKDNCPFWDLTSSYFDKKCIDPIKEIIDDITWKNNDEIWTDDANTNQTTNEDKDFSVIFELPIENKWNTHIKPTWEITLIDEDWNKIKQTWKEFIVNDAWVIVWEKVVDYIPLNDFGGSVIPGFDRKYICEWKWFTYKKYDQNEQKEIISYWSPSEYYTKQNEKDAWFIMFWERVNERLNHKKVTAVFDVSYKDENWKDIEFNSAEDFYVDYKEKYVWLNPYVILPLWFLLFLLFICWIIAFKRKRKCPNCGKKVDKDMKVCPYCGEKLHKSNRWRKKKQEENIEEEVKIVKKRISKKARK